MALVSAGLCDGLLFVIDADHSQCFHFNGLTEARPDRLFESTFDAATAYWAVLKDDVSHAILWVLLLGPFVGFAAFHALVDHPRVRLTNGILWLMFLIAIVLILTPLQDSHDCDRKGSYAIFGFFLFAPLGLIISGAGAIIATRTQPSHPKDPS